MVVTLPRQRHCNAESGIEGLAWLPERSGDLGSPGSRKDDQAGDEDGQHDEVVGDVGDVAALCGDGQADDEAKDRKAGRGDGGSPGPAAGGGGGNSAQGEPDAPNGPGDAGIAG